MHDSVGISTWDSYDFMAMCSGGRENLGFTCQDLSNYVQALRQTPMEDGGKSFCVNGLLKSHLVIQHSFTACSMTLNIRLKVFLGGCTNDIRLFCLW
ncbi:hypothetical protein LINPERPRIM_LOCUS30083 [Linum perenne]